MQNLGKFLLFFLLPFTLHAMVDATVDRQSIEAGESVTLTLNISGENVTKPTIYTLCSTDITASGSSTNIAMVNGSYTKKYALTYQFAPLKSCEIAPIEISVNGKRESTKPIKIEVKKAEASKDDEFSLALEVEKKSLLVGEPFELTLIFKQRRDATAIDSNFVAPALKGFWIKSELKPIQTQEDNYNVTKVVYTLAAQRSGTLHIAPAQMKIAKRSFQKDVFGYMAPNVKWKTYLSNELDIDVAALPQGVAYIGDFTISAKADKTEVHANEAVKVSLEIGGEGNLEDIVSMKPYIEGVSVFDEKGSVTDGVFRQNIAFVGERDFTIAPFELTYVDVKTKEIKTIKSEPINIHILNPVSLSQEPLKIQKQEPTHSVTQKSEAAPTTENSWIVLLLVYLAGMATLALGVYLKPLFFKQKERELSIKDPKILLMKLLEFKDEAEVVQIIAKLEKHLYEGSVLDVDKKSLNEVVKKYLRD